MKHLLLILSLFGALSLQAQLTTDNINAGLTGKEWLITEYELFGVSEAPNPTQLNDRITFNSDMTFLIIENGKEYKGKWNNAKPVEYILCKSTLGNWTKMYKVISIGENEAVIQFKDVDLIKTNYHLKTK